MDLRTTAQGLFRWKIGSGHSISFWYDWWHDRGPFYLIFSNIDIYQSRIPRNISLRDFFDSSWQPSFVLDSMHSWAEPPPTLTGETFDTFTWDPHSTGTYTVTSAWNHLRRRSPLVPWHSFIWDHSMAPRHAFIMWLVSLNRLPTQVLLIQNRRLDSAFCAFCRSTPDSINHLYFECPSTNRLASFWATKCSLPWRNRPWRDHILWAMKVCGGSSFSDRLSRFSFGALVHIIWTERNNALFRNKTIYLPGIRKHLLKVVKDKVFSLGRIQDCPRNRIFQRRWALPSSIFEVDRPHH